MPRYLVQRTFTDGLRFPTTATGRRAVEDIAACNLAHGVTWVHSFVSQDDTTSWCLYDAPSAEAIAAAARDSHLPVDSIRQITVLDPYFYAAP